MSPPRRCPPHGHGHRHAELKAALPPTVTRTWWEKRFRLRSDPGRTPPPVHSRQLSIDDVPLLVLVTMGRLSTRAWRGHPRVSGVHATRGGCAATCTATFWARRQTRLPCGHSPSAQRLSARAPRLVPRDECLGEAVPPPSTGVQAPCGLLCSGRHVYSGGGRTSSVRWPPERAAPPDSRTQRCQHRVWRWPPCARTLLLNTLVFSGQESDSATVTRH